MYKFWFLAAFCLWFVFVAQQLSADETDPTSPNGSQQQVNTVGDTSAIETPVDPEKQKAEEEARKMKEMMDHATNDPSYFNALPPDQQAKLRDMASKQESGAN